MTTQLLAFLGVMLLLISVAPVSAASPAMKANDSIQDVVDQSGIRDPGAGSGPITPRDGGGPAKPTMTFPSGTVTIATGEAGQQGGSAQQSAGAAVPMVAGAFVLLVAARRLR